MGLVDRQVAWAKGGAHAPTGMAGRFPDLATSTWEVVKAGAAAHMPLEERLAYAQFYDRAQAMRWTIEAERAVFLRLFGYSGLAALTPAEARNLLADAAQARALGFARSVGAAGLLESAKAIGVEPLPYSPPAREALAKLCALASGRESGADRTRSTGEHQPPGLPPTR